MSTPGSAGTAEASRPAARSEAVPISLRPPRPDRLAALIGQRVGPYEITAKLGEGGMGEVYRATDTKLKRDVAIKVLPAALTADKERLARFEREAQLFAQLQHPNIASIYGLEESGGTRALVMELVEGPTLAERLEQGPLPFHESLSVSLQIAHALEEAHEKGIIHRDLKPQNIKASIEGKVKVLDFGLAKAMDPASASGASSDSQLAKSPTLTLGGTQMGVILGTAAYMAPEQAKGLPVDKRADIWAFGVVLYEMLAGGRLFVGESVVEVLGSVMRQPIDFDRLPATTLRRLRDLVRRCLERNPKSRLRDIGDARLVIDEVLAMPDEPPGESGVAVAPAPATRRRWLELAAVAVVAAIGGAVVSKSVPIFGGRAASSMPSFRFQKLTFQPGVEWGPELSADGKTLFFAAGDRGQSDLYSVPVGAKKPTRLTPGDGAYYGSPRLSPDGGRLAFASSRDGGGLFVMGVNGESLRRLADHGHDPVWSPDGRSIAYSTDDFFLPHEGIDGGELRVLELATGGHRTLVEAEAQQPSWSPSGRRLAYWGNRDEGINREVWTIGLEGGKAVPVADHPAVDWSPVWSEDGRHLYFLSDRGGATNLWRVALDEMSGRVQGEPASVPLPADEVIYLSRTGRRWVYAAYSSRSSLQRFEFDPLRLRVGAAPRLVLSSTAQILWSEVSPDGGRIAYTTQRPQQDLYVVSAEGGGAAIQLTDDPGIDRYPSWAADGQRIFFMSERGEKYEVWAIRPDGSGLQAQTRTTYGDWNRGFLSRQADRLAVTAGKGLALFDASGPPPWEHWEMMPPPAGETSYFNWPRWSPSGDRLAGGVTRGSDPRRVGIFDLESRSYRLHEPFTAPVGWFPEGRRLLVLWSHRLAVLDLASGEVRPVPDSPQFGDYVSASHDLRTLVAQELAAEADIWLAEELPAP